MFDQNLIFGLLIAAALVLILRYVFPLYQDRSSIYAQIKAGLLVFGYAIRDEKIKAIADSIFKVVSILETWDISNSDKKYAATEVAYRELIEEFGLVLDPEAIDLLVEIAVAHLPKTDKSEVVGD